MDEHHVRCVDITFALDDPAFAGAAASGAKMSLLESNPFHANATARDVHGDDPTLGRLRRAGAAHDLDQVAFSNLLHLDLASEEGVCIR